MATTPQHPTIGSLMGSGGGDGSPGRFHLWPIFSAASFRRRIIEVLACGASGGIPWRTRKARGRAYPRFEFGSPVSAEAEPRGRGINRRSERLGELLRAEASSSECGSEDAEAETRRKVEAFEEMQGVVKRLQCRGDKEEEGKEAAGMVRRLAKDDPEARETLAMLGAIPPLVGMLDSGDAEVQISALYALLNLGIGNDRNKAAIVKAGAVHKMLRLIEPAAGCSPPVSEVVVANFLGLSAHDSNKPVIGSSSGAIPFLLAAFKSPGPHSPQARQDALRALYNLSIDASNAPRLVDAGLVPAFLSAIGDMDVTDRVLFVLSNLVCTPEGRRALSRHSSLAFPALVDVLYWSDAPACQEAAVYVLMVMAHKGYAERSAMVEASAVSALLELTLLGTAIAQKRASRILEFLAVDKGKQQQVSGVFETGGGCSAAVPVSAPQCGGQAAADDANGVVSVEGHSAMSGEKKAVKQLVQQSLQTNLRRIVKRANLPQDFEPSDQLRTLTATSTSKSLPF